MIADMFVGVVLFCLGIGTGCLLMLIGAAAALNKNEEDEEE